MTIPEALIHQLAQGRVVPFVGSGVSLAVEVDGQPVFPSWGGLLGTLAERLQEESNEDAAEIVRRYVKKGQLNKAADEALDELGLAHFREVMQSTFGIGQPADVDLALPTTFWSLRPKLVVTTNYDRVLQWSNSAADVVTNSQPAKLADLFSRSTRAKPFVWHLHGHIDDPDSLILAPQQYDRLYREAVDDKHPYAAARLQLRTLIGNHPLLFVGFGLQDEYVMDALSAVLEIFGGNLRPSYALLKTGDDRARTLWDKYKIQTIEYADYGDPLVELVADTARHMNAVPADPQSLAAGPAQRALAALPETVSAYLSRLADETSRLKMLGMGRSLQIDLPIEEAYVPLQTTLARSLEQRGTERFKEHHAEVEANVDLGEVFCQAERLGQRGVVLLGEPGSGKTTGARQIAWRLASRQCLPEDLGLPAGIAPVLLRFRNLSRAALAEENGLRMFLASETHCATAPDGLAAPGDDLWNGDGLLWILDGLDEVIDPGARKTVSGWVEEALGGRTNDRFLVTCRFAGFYRDGAPMLGPSFVEFHVRPLDDGQVERFVRDWFGAAYRKLLHPPELAEARADKLLEILTRPAYQAGHIRELCTNPLLLTILCIVFHDEQTLPTNRAELYALCVRVLLQHWRRDLYESELGSGVQPYDAEAAQAVLARVAWWMHGEQDRTAAPLDELAAEAELGLADVAASCALGHDGRAFVERMKDEAGVLAGEGEGRCGFLHLSFQEYLAADYAAREGKARELASRAPESWWREVALLSLRRSRPFCEEFFRELLAAGIAEEHPDLADRCLSEALFFSAAPFLETLDKADSPRRVAAVLRLLRDRADQVPELAEIARRLATADDREIRGFAREILERLGITLPKAADEREVFVDELTRMTFVEIPAGEFQMGAEKSDRDNERPVHCVQISEGFWLGKYPVTNAQYAQFMKESDREVTKPLYWDDRRFNQPEQPVVGVSWDDAQAFCEWAGCRLPTEAEWEYACRAGTTTQYSFGDDEALLGDYAWFDENSGGQTQPVGTKSPNGWDLHDMHGNVWEWCQDWFGDYSSGPVTDPKGPETGSGRVLRGGSWNYGPRVCRSAFRFVRRPENRIYGYGFRAART